MRSALLTVFCIAPREGNKFSSNCRGGARIQIWGAEHSLSVDKKYMVPSLNVDVGLKIAEFDVGLTSSS